MSLRNCILLVGLVLNPNDLYGQRDQLTANYVVSPFATADGNLPQITCTYLTDAKDPTKATTCNGIGWPLQVKGSSDVHYTANATSDGDWLSIAGTTGSGTIPPVPASITVKVQITTSGKKIADGTHDGMVMINCSGAINCPMTGKVTLIAKCSTCSAPQVPNSLILNAGPYGVIYKIGESLPAQPSGIQVTSTQGPLSYSATISGNTSDSGQVWLSLNSSSGTTPGGIGLSLNPAGLTAGSYVAQISVSASAANNSPQTVQFNLLVVPADVAVLTVTPISLAFSYTIGSNSPPEKFLNVLGSPASQSVKLRTSGESWLSATLISVSTPTTVTVKVNPSNLAPGNYTGSVILDSDTAKNVPLEVPVTLTVMLPDRISFLVQTGYPPPAAQCISLAGTLRGDSFDVSASDSWIIVNPASGTLPATSCISVNAGSLGTGNYNGNITIKGMGAAPYSILVTLVVYSAPRLSVDQSSIRFIYQFGSDLPGQQRFIVSSDFPASDVPVTATATTSSGGDWLGVTPGSLGTPASFFAFIKKNNLPQGDYTGAILLSSSVASNSPLRVPVTLTIPKLTLQSKPPSLSFNYEVTKPAPAPQDITLTSVDAVDGSNAIVGVAVTGKSTPASWLKLISGTTTATALTVSVDPSTLNAGTYSGNLTVESPSVANSPLNIPITLTVSNPSLNVTSNGLSFTTSANADVPAPKEVTVTSSGKPFNFVVSSIPSNSTWLAVDKQSGQSGDKLKFSITTTKLAAGVYRTPVTISSPDAANSQVIDVTLTVRNQPALFVSPRTLSFNMQYGYAKPASQMLFISAANSNYTVSIPQTIGNWIQIDSQGGVTPGAVTVSVKLDNLSAGTYTGSILVTAPGVAGSPMTIPVTLNATSTPVLNISPKSLSFSALAGSTTIRSQQLVITTPGDVVAFSVSPLSNGNWLSVVPVHGVTGTLNTLDLSVTQTPSYISVMADATGLQAGLYSNLLGVLANGSQSNIPVTLTLSGNRIRSPQVAFGGGWETMLMLHNSDTAPASVTVTFYNTDGTPLSVPLDSSTTASRLSDTIPAGGVKSISVAKSANATSQGWAEITSDKLIAGTTILRQRPPNGLVLERSTPMLASSGSHFLVPFDNTASNSTSAVILFAGTSAAPISITATIRDEFGNQLASRPVMMNSHTQATMVFTDKDRFPETKGTRGVAEFTTTANDVSITALLQDSLGNVTAIPAISLDIPIPAGGTFNIPDIEDGKDVATTFILANTGQSAAPFSIKCTDSKGSPQKLSVASQPDGSEYTDTVPGGGSLTFQTSGTGATQVQCRGRLTTYGSIVGSAVVGRALGDNNVSSLSSQLASPALRQFVLPFDNSGEFTTRIFLENQDATQSGTIQFNIRDQTGALRSSKPLVLALAPSGYTIIQLPSKDYPEFTGLSGVIEVTASNVDLAATSIRSNSSGSVVSFQPLPK